MNIYPKPSSLTDDEILKNILAESEYGVLLVNVLFDLRKALENKHVSSVSLQTFPISIFMDISFKGQYRLARWICEVIENWIVDVDIRIHGGDKKRLFDSFMENCKDLSFKYSV